MRKTQPHQFAGDYLPFLTPKLVPNAVGGKFLVAPLADGLSVGAGEHFHNVVEAKAKVRFLLDAVEG